MDRVRLRFVGLYILALAGTTDLSLADDINRGRMIAEARCGRCHAVGTHGGSPQIGLVPFRQLADRFPIDMLTHALATGDIGGHDEMPMFNPGRADARNLIAYIDSLAPPGSRYLEAKR